MKKIYHFFLQQHNICIEPLSQMTSKPSSSTFTDIVYIFVYVCTWDHLVYHSSSRQMVNMQTGRWIGNLSMGMVRKPICYQKLPSHVHSKSVIVAQQQRVLDVLYVLLQLDGFGSQFSFMLFLHCKDQFVCPITANHF